MAEGNKVVRVLKPGRFELTEHANQDKTITVEEGTKLSDLEVPAFYSNVAVQLRPYDHIRVRIDTGEWYAELLVLSCGKNWAKVKVLNKYDLESKDTLLQGPDLSGYEVKYRGPHHKHSVVRVSDSEVIKDEFSDKREAEAWLLDYVKQL